MGKVVEEVKLTSLFEPEKSVEVDAIIDTGATMLVLPQDVIEELGLRKIGERRVRYANNQIQIKSVYRGVILELKGRDGIFDVLGEVEGSEPLVGQIVLEALDLIVDPITKTVIPNPRSPDMPMTEILMVTALTAEIRLRCFAPPPKFGKAGLRMSAIIRNCKTRKYLNMQETIKNIEEGMRMGKVVEEVKLTSLFEQEKSVEVYSDSGHSALLRTLPFGSLNRWICGSLTLRPNLPTANFTYPQNVIRNRLRDA